MKLQDSSWLQEKNRSSPMEVGVIAVPNVDTSELPSACVHKHLGVWPRIVFLLTLLVQISLWNQSTPIMDGEFCTVIGRNTSHCGRDKSTQSCAQTFAWCQSSEEPEASFLGWVRSLGFTESLIFLAKKELPKKNTRYVQEHVCRGAKGRRKKHLGEEKPNAPW